MPLPLLKETLRSAVLLSDLLTERSQFEWLLAACVTLYQLHPVDDEIVLQYLVLGLCKAAAVLNAVSRGHAIAVAKARVEWDGGVIAMAELMLFCEREQF